MWVQSCPCSTSIPQVGKTDVASVPTTEIRIEQNKWEQVRTKKEEEKRKRIFYIHQRQDLLGRTRGCDVGVTQHKFHTKAAKRGERDLDCQKRDPAFPPK